MNRKLGRPRSTSPTFACGHPRSVENSQTLNAARGYTQCRACSIERSNQRRKPIPQRYDPQRWLNERHVVPKPVPRPPLDLSSDPHVALYRDTKASRADHMAPLMEQARREMDRLLEAAKTSQRGGRPKGSKNGARLSESGLRQGMER